MALSSNFSLYEDSKFWEILRIFNEQGYLIYPVDAERSDEASMMSCSMIYSTDQLKKLLSKWKEEAARELAAEADVASTTTVSDLVLGDRDGL